VEWGGGRGHYSGRFSADTCSFILKYWLKRRTAYLREREREREREKGGVSEKIQVYWTYELHGNHLPVNSVHWANALCSLNIRLKSAERSKLRIAVDKVIFQSGCPTWLHTPRSQSRWWRPWPGSEPRDPRRNEMPSQGDRRERAMQRGLAEARWQQQQTADTETPPPSTRPS